MDHAPFVLPPPKVPLSLVSGQFAPQQLAAASSGEILRRGVDGNWIPDFARVFLYATNQYISTEPYTTNPYKPFIVSLSTQPNQLQIHYKIEAGVTIEAEKERYCDVGFAINQGVFVAITNHLGVVAAAGIESIVHTTDGKSSYIIYTFTSTSGLGFYDALEPTGNPVTIYVGNGL